MNKNNQTLSKALRAGNFNCQELHLTIQNMNDVIEELGVTQQRFPASFSNLNIALNVSEIEAEDGVLIETLVEAKRLLESLGHTVVGCVGTRATIAQRAGVRNLIKRNEPTPSAEPKVTPKPTEQKKPSISSQNESYEAIETMIVNDPVRSGMSIYAHRKNLVVVGDVKRGAEIASDHSIIVFGKLEGRAHAGANGAEGATIVANSFDPEVVSINGIYIANQDIKEDNIGKHCLVCRSDGKLITHVSK